MRQPSPKSKVLKRTNSFQSAAHSSENGELSPYSESLLLGSEWLAQPTAPILPVVLISDYDDGTETFITDFDALDYSFQTYAAEKEEDGEEEEEERARELYEEDEDDEEIQAIGNDLGKNQGISRKNHSAKTEVASRKTRRPSRGSTIRNDGSLKDKKHTKGSERIQTVAKRTATYSTKTPSRRSRKATIKTASKVAKMKPTSRKISHEAVMDKLERMKKDNLIKEIDEILNKRKKLPYLKKVSLEGSKEAKDNDYGVTAPQGDDLYQPTSRPVSLPHLETFNDTGRIRLQKRRGKSNSSNSVLYPYIHGITRTVESRASSAKSYRKRSATTGRSKDDSRIQYELILDDDHAPRRLPFHWRARHIRLYRNGDRFFPGLEYSFRIGRDVLNIEGLCDKVSDRLGLARGARYIFGLDGTRKYRLEELDDGGSYVVSSDRKFTHLPYTKRLPVRYSQYNYVDGKLSHREDSPAVRLAGKRTEASDSGNSSNGTNSSSGKPSGSREGRTIKVINITKDKTQEVSVLVNMKTAQAWEDVVTDLGKVLKMKGEMKLYTPAGQEVNSFSQFKNDFADLGTFYLRAVEDVGAKKVHQPRTNSPLVTEVIPIRKKTNSEKTVKPRQNVTTKTNLRRFASEPSLRESVEEDEDFLLADGRAVSIFIHGQKRILYPPRAAIVHNPTPPSHTLTIDWVYGYRGADTRRNLWVVSTTEMLYFVAAIAVLYDRRTDTQRHYTEHTDDIQCIALHPTRGIVASGQRAAKGNKMSAHVRVWSVKSLNTLHVLGERDLGVGITTVAFSPKNKGQYLLAVDADQEHILSVWTWETERLYGKVATHQDYIYGACFHPTNNNLIIVYGKGILSQWSRRKDGIFQKLSLLKEDSETVITTVEFTSAGDLLTGDLEGRITVWSIDQEGQFYVKVEFVGHEGPISSLQQLSEGTILSGGEKDRKIIAWDSDEDFEKVEETKLPDLAGGVRTIYPQRPGESDGDIYVGTNRNIILEGSLQRKFNQIVFGHSKQLWGLAVNQSDGAVATAGYDKQIVKWRDNRLDWRIQAQGECVSIAIHPYGTVIVSGTIDGHLIVLNAVTGMLVLTTRICGSPISCLSFSRTGDLLAVGSQNGSLYIFRTTKDGFVYSRQSRMSGFQPLSGIDWSESGNYLQTVTSDYDMAYWNVREMTLVKQPVEVRNEIWITQTCALNYMIHGIWAGKKNSPTQVTVDKNERRKLLAAGDTEGYLRLYRYPVISDMAGYHEYKVYTSYLSAARFSQDEDYLYTVGGTDAAFMRWRIE